MKKIIFALFVAIAATVSFSSCGGEVEDITLSDVAGSTFTGKDSSASEYVIIFGNSSAQTFTFTITDEGNTTPDATYAGTFTVENNVVTLNYSSGTTVETMTGDGPKALMYNTVTVDGTQETITLKK